MSASTTFGSSGCTFASSALGSDKVRVLGVRGIERLGQLYEFRVVIAHDDGALTDNEVSDLLLAPCTLTLGSAAPIHGIAREVAARETTASQVATYEIVLVPTTWLLTVSKVSRLYQAMSVKDMAADVLSRYGLAAHADLRIAASATREFCVQYKESDWDFLQRWFEHEGFFYWFEHSSSGEKLVVTDDNASTTPIDGDASMPYRELAGMTHSEESVFQWRSVQRRIPAHVVLKDYNEQKPLLPIVGQADIDRKRGFGVFFEYGDNFDTPAAGSDLAQKRAQRFLTEQLTLNGTTDSPRFHVGHAFELKDHFDEGQNRKYLVTAIQHHVPLPSERDEHGELTTYRARFEAIPLSVQFRPERTTPWPSVHGLMHGHVDSDSSGKYSTLDEQGRYRVRFPFDTTGKKGENCSIWVRMAQHYAGSGYGSHYPLHKGTEVLLAFYDGDPDRPVIVGSVANALTPSPAAGANASQSVVRTASGIRMVMDDEIGH
ncbi:MAG: type VI secretion system Vgr family protein [Polyangiaceae bacterium]